MSLTMDRRRVTFDVIGIAQPKGSTRAFVPKGWTRPIITADNPRTKGWQQLVAEQAQRVAQEGLFVGPVILWVTFSLPRPISLPKRVVQHTKNPDLDKLARVVCDALTGVLYHDDAQVVELHVFKLYAAVGSPPRARITLETAVLPVPTPAALFAESEDR
jgi:Holliday junction resolvase RusA-like endonuclease